MRQPWPNPVFKATMGDDHLALGYRYAQLRQATTELSEFLGRAADNEEISEADMKDLDLAFVCLRLGYKRIKKVLERNGAEVGRRRLGWTE